MLQFHLNRISTEVPFLTVSSRFDARRDKQHVFSACRSLRMRRGKAADPWRFCDSQEWHKITIGFLESVLTGIYRHSPDAQTRLNEIARNLSEETCCKISKETTYSRLSAYIFYGPIQRAIYGRAIKTRGGPSNTEDYLARAS